MPSRATSSRCHGEAMSDYWVGLDLGQANDYTAVVGARRRREQDAKDPKKTVNHYDIAQLKRYPLGTPYPTIVEEVTSRLKQPPYLGNVRLIIDGTGVGRGVVDLFRLPLGTIAVPITITASGAPTKDEQGYWHVAKRDLIGTVQVLLQTVRLWIAPRLPEAPLLTKELTEYQVKITAAGNDTYNAREGQHDDLVLALALACWAGEAKELGRPMSAAAGGKRPALEMSELVRRLSR